MLHRDEPTQPPLPLDERLGPWGLSALFAALYFIQGISEPTEGLVAQPVMSLLKAWGYEALGLGAFSAALAMPWALKPLWGLISDFVPLAGYHRRSYLLLASLVTCLGFVALASLALEARSVPLLFGLLLLATLAVSFSDVVIDALMVEKGQPRGLTGRFQAMQWGAIYAATILTGALGGYLSSEGRQSWAFGICAALAAVGLWLALVAMSDRHAGPLGSDARHAFRTLCQAAVSRRILAAGAFLFLWNFNPFALQVLYLYVTKELHLSEQVYGNLMSLEAVAGMTGSLLYGVYCRRVPMRWLLHGAILLGVLGTASYWLLVGERSAQAIVLVVGLAMATGTVIQLDLAARVCPPRVAATLFALLMALSNLGTSLSRLLGGWCYQRLLASHSSHDAFNFLVGLGVACTAGCWLIMPWIRADGPAGQHHAGEHHA